MPTEIANRNGDGALHSMDCKAACAAAGGVFSEQAAMDVLKAASQPLTANDITSYTQWSVVYNMDALTASVAIKMDYDNPYAFSLR